MFKRLRERITEEASKSVAQLGNNAAAKSFSESDSKTPITNSTEDLITLSECSASVLSPHASSQQFSIGEDDDGSMSEQSTPQKKVDVSNGSSSYSTPNTKEQSKTSDSNFSQEYHPKRLSYIPQSDIESEREEPPTLNLEGISKDQLLGVIDLLKARTYKYKNKYSEVVTKYKELREEKLKIEKTLIDTQDKGSRRIGELREQCTLEQNAKAHLEANLRILLEEKDNRISVLETQINLLKDSSKADSSVQYIDQEIQSLEQSNDLLTGDTITSLSQDSSAVQEKIERLEHQVNQAKKTITAQTDQISLLRKQNENLSHELEEKIGNLNALEDQIGKLTSEHESVLNVMQVRLEELEKQQEESAMAMAETKRNMHEELELKEKQLVKAKKEASQYQSAVEAEKQKAIDLQKHYEDKVKDLQRQMESTEKTLEEEKQNLMHDFARGKTAALALMQKDCAEKISAVEEEWKTKLEELQSQKIQCENKEESLSELQNKLEHSYGQIQELNTLVKLLEKENDSLKTTIEKHNSENMEKQHKESLKDSEESCRNTEKEYATQIQEMMQQILLLENEKIALKQEKINLSRIHMEVQENNRKLKSQGDKMMKEQLEKYQKVLDKMKDQQNTIQKLESELKSLAKESSEKIEVSQEKVKLLEHEREQLMHEAQERVLASEAKCKEELKLLEEEKNKLCLENKEAEELRNKIVLLEKELKEILKNVESSKVESDETISLLRKELSENKEKLLELESEKQVTVKDLLEQLQQLKVGNSQLIDKVAQLESLKSEKEALNVRLKKAECDLSSMKDIETERNSLKSDNASLLEQLNLLKSIENEPLRIENSPTEEHLQSMSEHLQTENEKLKTEINELRTTFDKEVISLKDRNEYLTKQIDLLEKVDSFDPSSSSVKNYIASIKQECKEAIKAKEDDMETKLKLLVRDFAEQMDIKDRDCDKITSEILERNHDLEERLTRQHRNEIVDLRQSLFEKECALDEIRDDYEEKLQEKEKKIKEYETVIRNISQNGSETSPDSALLTAESSDWDDTWAVPEETIENTISPISSNIQCEEHIQEIETLKEEVTKCNSEIKELKVLLRLSPPESMVNNNNRRDSLQSIPEPTEFEYLKNIIYEYMMGKEPITLAKVIAAVLRFSETQTQQVIRKEEARHQMK